MVPPSRASPFAGSSGGARRKREPLLWLGSIACACTLVALYDQGPRSKSETTSAPLGSLRVAAGQALPAQAPRPSARSGPAPGGAAAAGDPASTIASAVEEAARQAEHEGDSPEAVMRVAMRALDRCEAAYRSVAPGRRRDLWRCHGDRPGLCATLARLVEALRSAGQPQDSLLPMSRFLASIRDGEDDDPLYWTSLGDLERTQQDAIDDAADARRSNVQEKTGLDSSARGRLLAYRHMYLGLYLAGRTFQSSPGTGGGIGPMSAASTLAEATSVLVASDEGWRPASARPGDETEPLWRLMHVHAALDRTGALDEALPATIAERLDATLDHVHRRIAWPGVAPGSWARPGEPVQTAWTEPAIPAGLARTDGLEAPVEAGVRQLLGVLSDPESWRRSQAGTGLYHLAWHLAGEMKDAGDDARSLLAVRDGLRELLADLTTRAPRAPGLWAARANWSRRLGGRLESAAVELFLLRAMECWEHAIAPEDAYRVSDALVRDDDLGFTIAKDLGDAIERLNGLDSAWISGEDAGLDRGADRSAVGAASASVQPLVGPLEQSLLNLRGAVVESDLAWKIERAMVLAIDRPTLSARLAHARIDEGRFLAAAGFPDLARQAQAAARAAGAPGRVPAGELDSLSEDLADLDRLVGPVVRVRAYAGGH